MRWLILAALAGCGRIDFDPMAEPVFRFELEPGAMLRDSTGHHPDATCTNCPTPIAGRSGAGAAAFDGTQCVHLAPAADTQPSELTVTAWGRIGASTNLYEMLVGHPDDGATTDHDAYDLYYNVMPGSIDGEIDDQSVGQSAALDEWHHFATTFDGSTMTTYIDGEAVATAVITVPLLYDPSDAVSLGCDIDFGADDYFLFGALDDVRLYARVLAPSEIRAINAAARTE